MKNSEWLWIPRIVILIIIVFLAMFSIDVFDGRTSIWNQLLDFILHSVPSIVLLLILIFTWRKPLIAGILFILLGIAMTIFFNHYHSSENFLLIDFPVILIGCSFLVYEFLVKEKNDDQISSN